MATIGGKTPSRETALALLAQVERQAGVIARRYTGNEAILDRFTEFRTFIDALSEFQLFIDMVENRLGAFGPDERVAQARKLLAFRADVLKLEVETTSEFLDRMVTHDRPWPMGSQKFLRRRLTRLDDIAAFHAAHGAEYELTPPDAAQMQNIRDRVAAQIDNSVPLADFGDAVPPPPPEEQVVEAPVAEAPMPEPVIAPPPAPAPPPVEVPRPAAPRPAAAAPPAPTQPDVMIPGMMGFAPPPPPRTDASAAKTPAPVLPDLMIPGMIMPEPPVPESQVPEPPLSDDWEPPPPPSASPPPPASQSASVPKDFDTDYVSQKAKAVAQLAEKSAAQPAAGAKKKPAPQGMARRDFRLQVRNEADGYKYIEGNGLAVMTEVCRIANITIDDLAKTLELSRPGLVLILNGRDPVSTELLKTLRRLVLRTGGLS